MKKELTIKNEIGQLDQVATFVKEICEELNLPLELNANLNIVLEESISNIIFYAYPENCSGDITVLAELDDNLLIFTVVDQGKEFDPTQVEDVDITLSAEERSIGGLGIFIIRSIMNQVAYQRLGEKNILTMKKKLSKSDS